MAEVGLYGFAYKLFEFVLVIPTFFMNSVYPFMVLKVNREAGIMSHELANLGKKSFLFLLPASIFTLLVMWFLAPFITWIRPEFSGSVEAVRILALGIPFFFLTSLTMWILITLKQQKLLAFIYAFSMLVNIGLNLVFIPAHGFLAAAWTTVISEGIVLLLTVIAIRFRPHPNIT